MVWFFSKKKQNIQNDSIINISNHIESNQAIQNNTSKQSKMKKIYEQFKLKQKLDENQINANIFKSCVTKCLKQNNSNLKKTDGLHIAIYHCIQYCGEKWQHAISISESKI